MAVSVSLVGQSVAVWLSVSSLIGQSFAERGCQCQPHRSECCSVAVSVQPCRSECCSVAVSVSLTGQSVAVWISVSAS